VPVIVIGNKVWPGHKGTRYSFADTGKTIMEYLGVTGDIAGESYLSEIIK
jgi:phosphopentomutase